MRLWESAAQICKRWRARGDWMQRQRICTNAGWAKVKCLTWTWPPWTFTESTVMFRRHPLKLEKHPSRAKKNSKQPTVFVSLDLCESTNRTLTICKRWHRKHLPLSPALSGTVWDPGFPKETTPGCSASLVTCRNPSFVVEKKNT